jgi:hypothetical protein
MRFLVGSKKTLVPCPWPVKGKFAENGENKALESFFTVVIGFF